MIIGEGPGSVGAPRSRRDVVRLALGLAEEYERALRSFDGAAAERCALAGLEAGLSTLVDVVGARRPHLLGLSITIASPPTTSSGRSPR